MKIYIAASWRHKHAVEMLTEQLRAKGNEVLSFVENCNLEGFKGFDFEKWVNTDDAEHRFKYDSKGAMNSDLTIYIGPSGKDACMEVGMAYAKGKIVFGLYAKGEDLGLMRKCMTAWFDDYRLMLKTIELHNVHNKV